ncbi:MAG: hypothetical protein KGJ84_12200 [Elusimicrobia bacterium]|nr:hypothetical protein [Elusimicrobiota bacterium]
MSFIRKGIAERRAGDMAAAQRDIQAAMNADPTSHSVQEVYETMRADQTRQAETKSYVLNAASAMKAGRGGEAVAWAQKAYDRTPDEETLAVLEKVRHDSADLAVKRVAATPSEDAHSHGPKGNGSPLWPLFPAFILGGTAYSVIKSRRTVESEDGDNEDARPQPGEGQRFVAGALLAGMAGAGLYFAGAYVVPAILQYAAGPGSEQVMRLAQSEAGSINPTTQANGSMTSLYRAMSPAEYDELMQTRMFKNSINSLEGKFFAESAEHATEWGEKLNGNDHFRVVRILVPKNLADSMMHWGRLDGIGPARYADLDLLNHANPTITTVK